MPKFESQDIVYLGQVTHQRLPIQVEDTLEASATPDVTNRVMMFASNTVVTITNFVGGSAAQQLRIIGDGKTIVSNNTNIKTNTGANKTLTLNKVYTFNYSNLTNIWYENE